VILARWGGVGSHRYPVQFSGDTPSEWSMLQHQVEFTALSGNLGAAYWSHDIGGFFGRDVDEELFIRWSQFGAMSPVFRTHSDHGIREPWKVGARAKKLFRKQTRIRHALAPYFYTLSREAHETGTPIIRPLYLEYNDDDGGALYRKQQYLIGRDLLVIPADGPIPKGGETFRKRAYFPNGIWLEIETGETFKGIRDGNIEIPLERIPTYVREGAIIPSQKVGNAIGTAVPQEIHFDYFPDRLAASEYELYEDDGETKEHEKGRFSRLRVRGRQTRDAIELRIGKPVGSYRGMPKRRRYVVRARVGKGSKVLRAEARVGGGAWRKVPYRLTHDCLAGELKSGHTFCEVAVQSPNAPVEIRFVLG
jgi:alpha-glucosidase (family GH31 glycosyl hydrolase)